MNCNQVIGQVPQIIRRELNADERVVLIGHIKSCDTCRSEYHKFLKLVYSIDYKVVQPELELEKHLIDITQFEIKQPKSMGYIWTIAAAFLILLVSTIIVLQVSENPDINVSPAYKSISQKLVNEEWENLSNLLQKGAIFKEVPDEKIPLNLILSKLEILEQKGIHQFKINQTDTRYSNQEINVNKLIVKLRKVKKFKSEVSVREISEYLFFI